MKCFPSWFGDIIAIYLRRFPHRGQLRLIDLCERLTGCHVWNVKTRHLFRILLDRKDLLQWWILRYSEWDPEVAEVLIESWSEKDVFYDVGANIGYFSCFAAQANVVQIVAFEPFEELADQLTKNLQLNGFPTSQVRVERLALGNSNEMMSYVPGETENSGAGHLSSESSDSPISVPVKSLDSFLEETGLPAPTVMKLDVEGFERNVLEGAERLLETNPPHTIVFEADCDSSFGILDRKLYELLIDAGYRVKHLQREICESKENFIAKLA